MKTHGYSGRLSTATLAAGGTLGILIPPSVPLVVYAILTEQNIAKLFAAAHGAGPASRCSATWSRSAVYCACARTMRHAQRVACPGASAGARCGGVWPIVLIFVLVFGGIYGGVFTPTEGAAVGAVATLVAGLLQRELSWQGIQRSFLRHGAAPRR